MALFKKDIALLVLQYLDDEGLKNVYRVFCQESKHLSDEWQALQRGLKRVTFSKSLDNCLIEHAKVEALIRDFVQQENIKLDMSAATDQKVEYLLRHFRPAFRSVIRRNKRRFSNVDKSSESSVMRESSPKRVKENNDSYYSLMMVDTDARVSSDDTDDGEIPQNSSSSTVMNHESTPFHVSDEVQRLDVEQKEEIINTARDTLLDMPDLFSSIVAEKINSTSDLNPKTVIEELEKDQRFNDVFQELLEITATQNDLSFQGEDEMEEKEKKIEGTRELRQRVNKINYNEISKGKAIMKQEMPLEREKKKRVRKSQNIRKIRCLKPNERIVETKNEFGDMIRTRTTIDMNTLTPYQGSGVIPSVPAPLSVAAPPPLTALPSLNVSNVVETPQYSTGITVFSSIPVQCIPATISTPSQANDTIVVPCSQTPSGSNIIYDPIRVTPNTYNFLTNNVSIDVPIVVQNEEVGTEAIQAPISQEIIEAPEKTTTTTPQNTIAAIDKQKIGKCLSTPSRKFPHVRTLNFKTPTKLSVIMDESTKENGDTSTIRVSTSCPPDIKGTTDDQGMKSDVEGPVEEEKNASEPVTLTAESKDKEENSTKTEEIFAKPSPKKEESALEMWNRMRTASKNKNWDQHLREVNRHQEITVASEALRDTARKKRKKIPLILNDDTSKDKSPIKSNDKMYFKMLTPQKKIQKVRPTPQLAPPPEKPRVATASHSTGTDSVISSSSPQPSTSQEILSQSGNESTISIIAMSRTTNEPLQISFSQVAAFLPDTPLKDSLLNMPVTPEISVNPDITTPFTKFLNDLNLHSVIKNTDIATPAIAKTPGTDIRVSPRSTESKLASGYSSRATDYSSGGSYYKPDDIENKIVEQRINEDQMKATKEKLKRQQMAPRPSSSKEISDTLSHENILNRSYGRTVDNPNLNSPEKRAMEVAQLEEKKARTIRILKAQSQNRKKTQQIAPRPNTLNEYRRKKLSKIAAAAALNSKKKSLTPKKEVKPVSGGKDLRKIAPVSRTLSAKKRVDVWKKSVKSDEESIENIQKFVEKPKTPLRRSPRAAQVPKPKATSLVVKEKSLNLSSSSSSSSSSGGSSSSSDSESDSEDVIELNHELITCSDAKRFLSIDEDPTFQKRRQSTDAPKLRAKPFAFKVKDRMIQLTTSDVINLYEARSEDERRKRTSSGSAKKQVKVKMDQSGFEYVTSPAHGSPMSSSTPVTSVEKKLKPIIHIHSKNGEEILPSTPDMKQKTARMPLKIDMKQNQQRQSAKKEVKEQEKDGGVSVKPPEDAIDALLNQLHPS